MVSCSLSKRSPRAAWRAARYFNSREIDREFELRHAGDLIARERFFLQPSDESTASLRNPFPAGYYASCYLITERFQPDHEVWRAIHDLGGGDALVGVSRLVSGGSTIRVLAADSIKLTQTLRTIRNLLAQFIPALRCAPRKL